jgi:hypothetical protein
VPEPESVVVVAATEVAPEQAANADEVEKQKPIPVSESPFGSTEPESVEAVFEVLVTVPVERVGVAAVVKVPVAE